MGGFTLPSLPSVRSLLNTSPPLVYPSPSSTKHQRSRSGSTSDIDTPTRDRRASLSIGTLLPSSPSKHDDWEPLPSRVVCDIPGAFSRRNSITQNDGHHQQLLVSSPTRLTHRRAQSVLPNGSRRPYVSPMNRLHEISRNPPASASAISLPTLAELGDSAFDSTNEINGINGAHEDGYYPSASSSPNVRTRHRHGPFVSMIRPPSPVSPSSLLLPLPETQGGGGHERSFSSVPPPQAMPPGPVGVGGTGTMGIVGSMGPPALRPPTSPQRWSTQYVRPTGPLARRSTVSSTTSISAVSDVAVLATWSFPSLPSNPHLHTPDGGGGGSEIHRAHSTGKPSERLRERLQSLSALDTSSLPAPPPQPLSRASSTIRSSHPKALPTHLTPHHRHSRSSPTVLPLVPGTVSLSGPHDTRSHLPPPNPLLPPPRPQRRPTTSRLRQPNPLCMPIETNNLNQSGLGGLGGTGPAGALSSSPGSMISDSQGSSGSDLERYIDSSSNPSPTASVVSLPPPQTRKSQVSHHLPSASDAHVPLQPVSGVGESGRWWDGVSGRMKWATGVGRRRKSVDMSITTTTTMGTKTMGMRVTRSGPLTHKLDGLNISMDGGGKREDLMSGIGGGGGGIDKLRRGGGAGLDGGSVIGGVGIGLCVQLDRTHSSYAVSTEQDDDEDDDEDERYLSLDDI